MTNRAKKIVIVLAVVISIGLLGLGVLAGIAVYGMKAADRAGNEAATVQNLKTIGSCEIQYFNTHNRRFGSLDELVKDQLVSSKFAGHPVTADGYVLRLMVTPATNGAESSFSLTADPYDESAGRNHFYLDSTSGAIRVNPDGPARADDPPLSK